MFPAALAVVVAVFPVEQARPGPRPVLRSVRRAHRARPAPRRLAHRLDVARDLLGQRARRDRRPRPDRARPHPQPGPPRTPRPARRRPRRRRHGPQRARPAAGLGLGLEQRSPPGPASSAASRCSCCSARTNSGSTNRSSSSRSSATRRSASTSAVLFFAMLAFVPVFFFASVYAQVSLSASPNQAALFLLYFFIGFAIASQWGGRILDKRGARPAMKLGTALGAVGFALWANKLTDLSMHDQWPYAPSPAPASASCSRPPRRTRSTGPSTPRTARSPASPRPCATTRRPWAWPCSARS